MLPPPLFPYNMAFLCRLCWGGTGDMSWICHSPEVWWSSVTARRMPKAYNSISCLVDIYDFSCLAHLTRRLLCVVYFDVCRVVVMLVWVFDSRGMSFWANTGIDPSSPPPLPVITTSLFIYPSTIVFSHTKSRKTPRTFPAWYYMPLQPASAGADWRGPRRQYVERPRWYIVLRLDSLAFQWRRRGSRRSTTCRNGKRYPSTAHFDLRTLRRCFWDGLGEIPQPCWRRGRDKSGSW